jgi:hypothetical protein
MGETSEGSWRFDDIDHSVRKNKYSGVQLGLKSHKHWKKKHSI